MRCPALVSNKTRPLHPACHGRTVVDAPQRIASGRLGRNAKCEWVIMPPANASHIRVVLHTVDIAPSLRCRNYFSIGWTPAGAQVSRRLYDSCSADAPAGEVAAPANGTLVLVLVHGGAFIRAVRFAPLVANHCGRADDCSASAGLAADVAFEEDDVGPAWGDTAELQPTVLPGQPPGLALSPAPRAHHTALAVPLRTTRCERAETACRCAPCHQRHAQRCAAPNARGEHFQPQRNNSRAASHCRRPGQRAADATAIPVHNHAPAEPDDGGAGHGVQCGPQCALPMLHPYFSGSHHRTHREQLHRLATCRRPGGAAHHHHAVRLHCRQPPQPSRQGGRLHRRGRPRGHGLRGGRACCGV